MTTLIAVLERPRCWIILTNWTTFSYRVWYPDYDGLDLMAFYDEGFQVAFRYY